MRRARRCVCRSRSICRRVRRRCRGGWCFGLNGCAAADIDRYRIRRRGLPCRGGLRDLDFLRRCQPGMFSGNRVLVKGNEQRIWAYHDGVDLGGPAMTRIARDYGYTLDELRKL